MDIYRARFVRYPTPGINALAFSHNSNSDFPTTSVEAGGRHSLRLAVGRANGDIEIWNPLDGRWVQETVFKGGKGRSVEGLLWIQEPAEEVADDGRPIAGALRLFSIGYSNAVTEWNLSTGLPLREWAGNHSEVWCLAAQPRMSAAEQLKKPVQKTSSKEPLYLGQNIVAGCADGSIVILSTADNDLQFQKFLTRPTTKKSRVLSIAFQNRSTIVAGFADSTVRVYDIRKGSLIRNITLGAGPKGGPKDILVWSVKCLPNGDIVTGDSTGEVRFFDKKQLSQIQRIESHQADVLDLVVSSKSGTVFSAGMDRRTSRYLKGPNVGSRWQKMDHTTMHEHDVKALASHESDKIDVVASGGIDTNLVIVPLRKNAEEYQYTISGLPQLSPMASCATNRLFACWWEREVSIWRLTSIAKQNSAEKKHDLKARIAILGDENISSVSFSPSGTRIAVATSAEIKLFALKISAGHKGPYEVKKLCSIGTHGARFLKFSPDSRWLAVVNAANEVIVFSKGFNKRYTAQQHLKRKDLLPVVDPSLGEYLDTINRIEFSPDSKMLIACDLRGYVDSWILNTPSDAQTDVEMTEASAAHSDDSDSSSSSSSSEDDTKTTPSSRWKQNPANRPKLESTILIATFRPLSSTTTHPTTSSTTQPSQTEPGSNGKYNLVLITAKHRIREIDMLTGYFTTWTKHNPYNVLPSAFKQIKDRAAGSVWGAGSWLWIYGASWLFGIDTGVDHEAEIEDDAGGISSNDEDHAGQQQQGRKRKYVNTGAGDARKRRERGGLALNSLVTGHTSSASDNEGEDSYDTSDDDEEAVAEENTQGTETFGFTSSVRSGSKKTADGKRQATWYITHKYRPIVGIVAVKHSKEVNGKGVPPEVVLVERPLWMLDLPGRYENEYQS